MQWKRFIQLSLLALVALGVVVLFREPVVNAQSQPVRWLEQSPLPTPSPPLLSHEATIALQFVSKENKIPLEQLEFGSQQPVSLPTLGGGYSKTSVNFLKSDGTLACQAAPFLGAHQSISYYCGDTNVATAIVEGSQDLSVVVER